MVQCPKCKTEVFKDENGSYHNTPFDELMKKSGTPFICPECGSYYFPLIPLRDLVYVQPDKPKDKIGSIIVPESAKKNDEYGTVLAAGRGYLDKKGKFFPCEIKTGDRVIYDKTVPWEMTLESLDGRYHTIKHMGMLDVKAIIIDDEEIKTDYV